MKKYQYFHFKRSVQAPHTPTGSRNMIKSKIWHSIFFNDNLPPLFFGHRFPVSAKTGIFSDNPMNKMELLTLYSVLRWLYMLKKNENWIGSKKNY